MLPQPCPGFLPIGTHKGKIVVSGSKFSPSGQLIEENDTNAIYLYDHKKREFSAKLYQDPRFDVGGLTGSCRQASGNNLSNSASNELSAINYDTHNLEYLFFDKDSESTYVAIKSSAS